MTRLHDPRWRDGVLDAHGSRCFVCGRGPRPKRPLVAFMHDDPLRHSLSIDAATDKPMLVARCACRRCWGIATGTARAEKGARTKAENRRQLSVFGSA